MILLNIAEVVKLHSKLINKTGGSDGIRDMNMLESAVASVEARFGGYEKYPTIEEKAARLCFSLISNHAFIDGNKRIGIFVMLVTLELNDIKLNFTQAELIDLGLGVASHKYDYDDIYEWVIEHEYKKETISL